MTPIVQESDLLAQMVDQGFIRLGAATDSYQFWGSYRAEIVPTRTAPDARGGVHVAALTEVCVQFELDGIPSDMASLVARTCAVMCADTRCRCNPRRGSWGTHRVLIGAN